MNKFVYRIDIVDTSFQDYLDDMPESESSAISVKCVEPRRRREAIGEWFPLIPVFVRSPHLPASDFFSAPVVGAFAISCRVYEDAVITDMLESMGELLPMKVTGEQRLVYAFNSLDKILCEGIVDGAKCEKKYGRLSKIAFVNDLLPSHGLFSVPEAGGRVFAVHNPELPPEKDFVQWYRRQGYTGLKLIEAEKAYM